MYHMTIMARITADKSMKTLQEANITLSLMFEAVNNMLKITETAEIIITILVISAIRIMRFRNNSSLHHSGPLKNRARSRKIGFLKV